MSRVYFDHCYTLDNNFKFLDKLQGLGFSTLKGSVEHPGKHTCRFIHLDGSESGRYQYLEFVSVGRGGRPVTESGLSFGYSGDLERYYKVLKAKKRFGPEFYHRNYDWKNDNKSKLVGWDFVSFKDHGLSHLYPWFTAYGKRPGKRKSPKSAGHKMGKVKLVGISFTLRKSGEKFIRHILGSQMKLSCGINVEVIPSKRDQHVQVNLEVKKFDLVAKKADEIFYVNGKKYALIKNPSGMWNILITEMKKID